MTWGTARRPIVSNKLGIPTPEEGSDGDMQVRQTGIGARLFAKLGGRWFSNKLFGNEIDDPDVFLPKCWTKVVTMPAAGTSAVDLIKMPDYITKENILCGVATVFAGTNWAIQMNKSGGYECIFHINSGGGNNMIRVAQIGTTVQNKEVRLTIFFK